ncbi:5-formyltetrahydrofolate cyclo-ligase [Pseudonocardia aurantiaca]|uniref:5-formyltetrahydrofolate cyclo-ligase n=1 Tax=Pseudonocardia aurantiaca TaxID=75290 RepID=A0ABW4FCJ0_9PSEU
MPDERAQKAELRERVWSALDAAGASPGGARGRIPNFVGSDAAADRVRNLPGWRRARSVKANPDRAQQPVRAHALRDGKLLFMAVPKLARSKPFYRLDPAVFKVSPERLADRYRAAEVAPTVAVDTMPPIDFVICGSLAVNRDGVRIGKGAATDIEVALLVEHGLLRPQTIIVTTVHELQLLDEPLPQRPHDFTVDYIVSPERVIACPPRKPPGGVDWRALEPGQLDAIPVLRALAEYRAES